jgi:hypothetical protein
MEHRMQIQSNFMRYSITLRKFAKRAQTTFGAVAKGNLLPFGICLQKQKNYLCSAQTRTGIGLLEKPPAVNRFPAVESHLGVRTSYVTRRKRRYEANKCG